MALDGTLKKTSDNHKWDRKKETIKDASWNPIKTFDNIKWDPKRKVLRKLDGTPKRKVLIMRYGTLSKHMMT